MSIIKVKDKTFKTFIPEDEIQRRVKAVAEKINKDSTARTLCSWPFSTARSCSPPT